MARKIKLEQSAIDNVKRFFSNSPDVDVVSIEEAFKGWNRTETDPEKNKAWLSNVLFHLRYYGLVLPKYDYGSGRKKIVGIQLTLKGKKALGRIESEDESNTESVEHVNIKIEDILKALPKLKRDNPSFNIVFSVTPKEV